MDARLKTKWVEALRSGKYEQCRDDLTDGSGFCCIGVGFLQIGNVEIDDVMDEDDPTDAAAHRLGLDEETNRRLVRMNDDEKRSFLQIAEYIEKNL